MYRVESLCSLGRIEEASDLFKPEVLDQGSFIAPLQYPVSLGQKRNSDADDIGALKMLNTGIKLVLQENFVDGQKMLIGVLEVFPYSVVAIKALVYSFLRIGQPAVALRLLRGATVR
jgi:hypothetical protein